MKIHKKPRTWTDSLDKRPKRKKMDMRFGTWNVRSMCRIDNKVRGLIAVKVLHTSLLNIIVVAFKVLPLGNYAPMPTPSPPFKTIL
jgi:hypothetical protein